MGLDAFLAWVKQLDFAWLISTLITVAAALLCITFHETCHGFVAWKLGDPTAKKAGRLSLNPLRHVDIFGLVMMAVFKFGWAKAVPVDSRHFKNPKWGMAITALAGPVSNILLAFVALILYWVVLLLTEAAGLWAYLVMFLFYVAMLSVGLAVFNLIPIPPLDGSKVLAAVLPDGIYEKLMRYERYGMILLMAVLYFGILDVPLDFLRDGLLNLLAELTFLPFRSLFL